MLKGVSIYLLLVVYLLIGVYLYQRFEYTDEMGHNIFECAMALDNGGCAEGNILGEIDDMKRHRLFDGMILAAVILVPMFFLVIFPLLSSQIKNSRLNPIKAVVDKI